MLNINRTFYLKSLFQIHGIHSFFKYFEFCTIRWLLSITVSYCTIMLLLTNNAGVNPSDFNGISMSNYCSIRAWHTFIKLCRIQVKHFFSRVCYTLEFWMIQHSVYLKQHLFSKDSTNNYFRSIHLLLLIHNLNSYHSFEDMCIDPQHILQWLLFYIWFGDNYSG